MINRVGEEEEIVLFNEKRVPICTLRKNEIRDLRSVCVTLDDFGILALDLTHFLEKDDDAPFPWVVNLQDLETLVDGFLHLGLGLEEVLDYVRQRVELHGKAFGSDELEYAGVFLQTGSLEVLTLAEGRPILSPGLSSIFDDIYAERHGGPKVEIGNYDPLCLTELVRRQS